MKLKKISAFLLVMVFSVSLLTSCKNEEKIVAIEEILSDRIVREGENIKLINDTFSLIFTRESDGYGVEVKESGSDSVAFLSGDPVRITVGEDRDYGLITDSEYSSKYTSLKGTSSGKIVASSTVTTANQSEFEISDVYGFMNNCINVSRTVKVTKAGEGDDGMRTQIAFRTNIPGEKGNYNDCNYFIPGVYYKDNENLGSRHYNPYLISSQLHVKETRTGLPMVMLREKATGNALSIAHFNPEIYSPDEAFLSTSSIDDAFSVGSVGIIRDPSPAVSFTYPNYETQGERVTTGKTKRYACVRENNSVSFTVSIWSANTGSYMDAMTESYCEHFANTEICFASVDMDGLYDVAVEDLNRMYYFNEKTLVSGVNHTTYVASGDIMYNGLRIGFTGMQASLAYEMIRYGIRENKTEFIENGANTVSFWALQGCESGVIKTDILRTSAVNGNPLFLRTMTDGAEGMLDAYRLICAYDYDVELLPLWWATIKGYADFLVRTQNEDGSWYRAYNHDGQLLTAENAGIISINDDTVAHSKSGTHIPVRFLVRMYEFTGDERYLESAKRAGEYTISVTDEAEKFVGGTTDNPNKVDKESGIFCMYAMNALYSATGEQKYLDYAEKAAIYSLSWTYTFKFVAHNTDNQVAGVATSRGLNDGMSIIATGGSSADSFMAYTYYEFYKLYVWTGNELYLKAAKFLQNNTRQIYSYVSNLGYALDSYAIEATYIADFYFITAASDGVWLPWITNSNIEPMANMYQTFRTADIDELSGVSLGELKTMLSDYGAGGKPYGKVN